MHLSVDSLMFQSYKETIIWFTLTALLNKWYKFYIKFLELTWCMHIRWNFSNDLILSHIKHLSGGQKMKMAKICVIRTYKLKTYHSVHFKLFKHFTYSNLEWFVMRCNIFVFFSIWYSLIISEHISWKLITQCTSNFSNISHTVILNDLLCDVTFLYSFQYDIAWSYPNI